MDTREANRRTLAAYEAHVEDYLADLPASPTSELTALFDRVAALAPGGSVLEIGCGPGQSALELERRGLTVRRTDATVAFVERLRTLGYDADVLDARTDDLGGPYDVLLANAVLLHLSREDLTELVQRAATAVRYLAFTVKEGDGEAWTTRKLAAPRWFVYWREPALREVLAAAGWQVVSLEHHRGRYDDWLTVLAERT